MKAVAVFPGKPGSAHLTDIPEPSIDDVTDEKAKPGSVRVITHVPTRRGASLISLLDLNVHS